MSYSVRQPSRSREQKQRNHKHSEASPTSTTMEEHLIKSTYSNGSRPDGSNLECILDYTTPSVQCQYPAKSAIAESLCERWNLQSESMPFFILGDLWRSFDEWSAYGAGVPLKLPSGETIVQYYVPYLSALQIYLHPASSFFSSKSFKRPGEESDWSDASDMRDVNSDIGSDNENEKLSRFQTKAENWESSSSHSSTSSEQGDRQGELVFEYFERCSPYGRAPLAGKIGELATRFPSLLSLKSNELSPPSWLSVAWYPIYRIPMGPTMNDLSTCFLTFHSLWTAPFLQDPSVEYGATPNHSAIEPFTEHGNGYGCVSLVPDDCSCKLEQAHWLRDHLAWSMNTGTLKLPAFGLASYKLRGPFWASAAPADKQRASSLASSAEAWLKQLQVQHPDFEFFSSREGTRFGR